MTPSGTYQPKTKLTDLNVLPDRHQRRKIQPLVVLAFLFWAVLIGLLYPAGSLFLETQRDFRQAQNGYQELQAEVDSYQSVEVRLENLRTAIDNAAAEADQIKSSYGEIDLETTRWSTLLFSITDEIPQGVDIQEVNQSGTQVDLRGAAASYQLVLTLEDSLQTIPGFQLVEIDSIQYLGQVESPGEGETPPENFDEDFPYLFTIFLNTEAEEIQP